MSRITKAPEVRQAELMDAAEELFLTAGYQATAVSTIVKQVGVAQGTFYYYFSSKEAVLEAICARYAQTMAGEVHCACLEAGSILPKLQLFVNLFYRLCYHGGPGRLTKILYKEQQGQLINRLWRQMLTITTPLLRRILEEGNKEGITQVQHMDETFSFFAGIMAALLEASSPLEFGHEADQQVIANKLHLAGRMLETLLGLTPGSLKLTL